EGGESAVRLGIERWVPTVCMQCPAGCGITVRVVDGRVVKIEGNPLYPANLGRVCPKGQAGLQVLYDPDRIRGPLRRVGPRGSGRWERISWEDAIASVAKELQEIRESGEPQGLIFMAGRESELMHKFLARFMEAYGSPNHIGNKSVSCEGVDHAHYFTQGVKELPAYDLENTNYLLCFGGSFLEAMSSSVRLLRAYGHMRRGRPGYRTKIVLVDPRFSVTAAKADEWLPINPGTDGALALGFAHVIIREHLYDVDFVLNHGFGFEDWTDLAGKRHEGFREAILREYPPERVAEITGVPASTIERIAHEFAVTKPALAIAGQGSSMQSNGIYNRIAIYALNALVGSIDAPGGMLIQGKPPFRSWKPVEKDGIAQRGLGMPRLDHSGTIRYPFAADVSQVLPESIQRQDPYRVRALFLYYTNPLFSRPDLRRFHRALAKVPLVVSFSPFMDDSTAWADFVLPDRTYLERWQDDLTHSALGYPILGLRQPVVKPLHDTRETGDVLIALAKALGGSVERSFPWSDFKGALMESIKGVHEAQRGSIIAGSFEEFWEKLLKKGGWWDPPYRFGEARKAFKTPSGRFEFHSLVMRNGLEELARKEAHRKGTEAGRELRKIMKGLGFEKVDDSAFMAHYEPPRFAGDARQYPFLLNTYKTMTHAEGRGANQPFLQEIFGLHVSRAWHCWLEVNPDTARKLGIGDEDWVWVESKVGRIKLKAKLYPGARPDVVSMPFGFGHAAYGRWARNRGANPNWIIPNEHDRLSGSMAWFSTRVKVYKA
ncbi:MAG: molybdopterin-dependent oxidoreductase, partial [Nitrospinota bacterium]